jgi:hypothetical protein
VNRKVVPAAVVFVSLILAGCGGTSDRAAHTRTPVASITPAATLELSSVSALAFKIVEAVDRRDEASLRTHLVTHMVACVAEDSGEAGPFCRDGDDLGTMTEVISVAVCQGGWAAEIDQWVTNIVATAGSPYALAELPRSQGDWPVELYGETVVVFSPAGSDVTRSVALFLADAGIVRSQVGCKRADDFLTDNNGQPLHVLWRPAP